MHKLTLLLTVSKTVEGKRHDKKLLEDDTILSWVPPNGTVLGDSGYQGAETIAPWARFVTPIKKQCGTDLSATSRETNRTLSSLRVRVEHVIAYLKHFNILSQTFRGRIPSAHQPFINLACLYNFTRDVR